MAKDRVRRAVREVNVDEMAYKTADNSQEQRDFLETTVCTRS